MSRASLATHVAKRVGLATLLLCTVACGSAAAGIPAAPPPPLAAAAPASPAAAATPSAVGFAYIFVTVTNTYATAHRDRARISNADCVEAARGRYMCSYAISRPGRAPQCHVMQAHWTPLLASTFTITLAGRVKRCATLRQALRSLR